MAQPTPLTGAVAGLVALVPAAVATAFVADPLPFPPTLADFARDDERSTALLATGFGVATGLAYVPVMEQFVSAVNVSLVELHGALLWGVVYGLLLFGAAAAWLRFGAGRDLDQQQVTQHALLHVVFGLSLSFYVATVGVP